MSTEQEALKDLYSVTGNVTDINTLLIGRDEYRKLVAERDADRAAMREALKAILPVSKFGRVGSRDVEQAALQAALTHLRQRLEVTT